MRRLFRFLAAAPPVPLSPPSPEGAPRPRLVHESQAAREARRTLLRHLSHQIKSPLAIIRTRAQQRGAADEFAQFTLCAIDAVASVIDQMLLLAWVETIDFHSDVGESLLEQVDLSVLARGCVASRMTLLADREIEVRLELVPGAPLIGNRVLISEAICNLLDNAIRHTPRAGHVTIRVRECELDEIPAHEQGEHPDLRWFAVEIEDDGPGIPSALREKVFEPFYGTTHTDEHGAAVRGSRQRQTDTEAGAAASASHGLGLTIVRAVTALHGGWADLTTRLDKGSGTRARLLLPGHKEVRP